MSTIQKGLIFIPMLFFTLMGVLAFLSPDITGNILGISAKNAAGRGTLTGDFGALFFTGAGAVAMAVFKNQIKLLWVPVSLLGITLIGRLFDILSSGLGQGAIGPVIIEAILIAMLVTALKLPKKDI